MIPLAPSSFTAAPVPASVKTSVAALLLLLGFASPGNSFAAVTPVRTADEVLAQLTRDEKFLLLSGRDDWHIGGIDRLGLPRMRMSDCGHGVTLAAPPYGSATCLPTSVGMASTWNEDVLFAAGELLGRETLGKGCGLLLGPMVNLHRVPLGGRNYETFSEDPLLSGKLAAALVRGVQATGAGACVKAAACNNQQHQQHSTSVEVSERPLRELYLRAFEIVVREARPWALMTSYNDLRGHQTSEDPHLLTTIFRNDWGFTGMIVSDWRAVRSTQALTAGLNLEMPGPGKQLNAEKLRPLLDSGQLSERQLDDAVRPTVELLLRHAALRPPGEVDTPRHRAIARRVADESLVLLKNDGLLPFDASQLRSLAVIGPNAAQARLGGGGSASVTPFYAVSVLDGLRARVGDRIRLLHAEGTGMGGSLPAIPAAVLRTGPTADSPPGLRTEFFDNTRLQGRPSAERIDENVNFAWGWAAPMPGVPRVQYSARWTGWLIPPVTGSYTLGIAAEQVTVRLKLDGQWVLNNWEEKVDFEKRFAARNVSAQVNLTAGVAVPVVLELGKTGPKTAIRWQWEVPGAPDSVDEAAALAASCDAAVVCVGLSNLFEGGTLDRKEYAMPGRQVELVRRVAAANPRTAVVLINGSVVSVAEWLGAVPAVIEAWYPGQEGGHAVAAALFGDTNPSGRLPDTIFRRAEDIVALRHYPGDGKRVDYREGMHVGYRQLRPGGDEALFPFGFGLSYTGFELVRATPGSTVQVEVRNTGRRSGATVVQIYRQRATPGSDDPWRELIAFRKVTIAAGAVQTVEIPLPADAFDRWSLAANRWERDTSIDSLWVTLDTRTGRTLSLARN
jgi:beta-glucosidase